MDPRPGTPFVPPQSSRSVHRHPHQLKKMSPPFSLYFDHRRMKGTDISVSSPTLTRVLFLCHEWYLALNQLKLSWLPIDWQSFGMTARPGCHDTHFFIGWSCDHARSSWVETRLPLDRAIDLDSAGSGPHLHPWIRDLEVVSPPPQAPFCHSPAFQQPLLEPSLGQQLASFSPQSTAVCASDSLVSLSARLDLAKDSPQPHQ